MYVGQILSYHKKTYYWQILKTFIESLFIQLPYDV